MKLLDIIKIDEEHHKKATFIRVEPINLQNTLISIVTTLSDISWISQFDKDYIRDSFIERATPTIKKITQMLLSSSSDAISSDAGEYIVSELSRTAINSHLKYTCIPLAELFSKQVSGNPGFDFHIENDCQTLIFGEAKYLAGQNAYGTGLQQIVEFISEKKDIKDLIDLEPFFESHVLQNATKGQKGFAVGFAAKSTASDVLISNILRNTHYHGLRQYHEIVLVAVNV